MKKINLLAALALIGFWGFFGASLAQEVEVVSVESNDATITAEVADVVPVAEVPEETFSDETPEIFMWHSETCIHCLRQFAFMPVLEVMYPGLILTEKEISKSPANAKDFAKDMKDRGIDSYGTPANIIGNEEVGEVVVNGFNADRLVAAFAQIYGPPILPLENAIEVAKYDADAKIDMPTSENSGEGASTPAKENPMGIWIALIAGLVAVGVLVVVVGKQND